MCNLCLNFPSLDWHGAEQPMDAGTAAGGSSGGASVSYNPTFVDQLDSGSFWTTNGSVATTISFGFTSNRDFSAGYSENSGWSATNVTQQEAIREMMQSWDDLIAPSLVEAAGSAANAADIKLSNTTSGISYAHAYYPGQTGVEAYSYAKMQGSVWLNSNYNSGTNNLVTPTRGIYGYQAIMHEIGHALGLNHGGSYNGGSPQYGNTSTGWKYTEDSHMYSIMSYFAASNTGANWGGQYAQTPMVYDIMAIQQMYGADYTTRAGNTVYGFNSTAGRDIYDFTKNTSPILTIWDGGGIDTIDVSGWSTSATIFLAAGSYSSVNGMKYNLAIAYDCDIENATTGAGNDFITGNDLNNILIGNAGNDTIDGALGNDIIDGGSGDDILSGGGGSDVIRGGDGNDIIDGGDQDDTLYGDGGADVIRGGSGNDVIYGGDGNDRLEGGDGNDILDGGAGADILIGGAGNDIIYISQDDVLAQLDGGSGYDVLIQTGSYFPINLALYNMEELRVIYTDTGTQNWSTQTDYYNVSGDLFRHDIVYDNGTSAITEYDTGNAFAWSERTRTYDSNGNLVSETSVADRPEKQPNSAPTDISLSSRGIAENAANGTVVGTLTTADPDTDDTFSYTLLDNAGGRFAISGSRLVVANGSLINYEAKTSHQVTVRVQDSAGNTIDRTFVIGVNDVNEAPTNITLSNATIIENAARGTIIGALAAVDPDLNDSFTFALLNDAGGRFDISGTDLVVKDRALLDYEDASSHSIVVQVTDAQGATFSKTLTINLQDEPGVTLHGTRAADFLDGGREGDTLWGHEGSDTLNGFAGNDTLYGGAGHDRLNGGAGDDIMYGGAGNDIYVVNSAGDVVIENPGEGIDTIITTVSMQLADNVENVIIRSSDNITVVGNKLANNITGNSGNNIIAGGGGADRLTGGEGADTFIFGTDITSGVAKIMDFTSGEDRIIIDTVGATLANILHATDGLPTRTAVGTFDLVMGKAPASEGSTILYNAKNGVISFDADGTGSGSAFVIAKVAAHLSLTLDDFLVI